MSFVEIQTYNITFNGQWLNVQNGLLCQAPESSAGEALQSNA